MKVPGFKSGVSIFNRAGKNKVGVCGKPGNKVSMKGRNLFKMFGVSSQEGLRRTKINAPLRGVKRSPLKKKKITYIGLKGTLMNFVGLVKRSTYGNAKRWWKGENWCSFSVAQIDSADKKIKDKLKLFNYKLENLAFMKDSHSSRRKRLKVELRILALDIYGFYLKKHMDKVKENDDILDRCLTAINKEFASDLDLVNIPDDSSYDEEYARRLSSSRSDFDMKYKSYLMDKVAFYKQHKHDLDEVEKNLGLRRLFK